MAFPETQRECVMHGCHRFRESVVSKLDAARRRSLCPLPGDIRHGCSLQIAFNIQEDCVPPHFLVWADGHASRQKPRGFDQVEVLGPLAHQQFLMEPEDWKRHLSDYRFFRDVRSDQRQNEPVRVDNSYVLGPGGVVWRQHIIDDWTQFQSKKNSPLTATPKVKPQRFVDEQKRLEYSLQMPDRNCPPGTPAEKPEVNPVAKGKGKGVRTTASSSW